jgi:hypothetical protein
MNTAAQNVDESKRKEEKKTWGLGFFAVAGRPAVRMVFGLPNVGPVSTTAFPRSS